MQLEAEPVYFHGTNTEAKALAILRDCLSPGMPSAYAEDAEPRAGRVYLTDRLATALRYACWPVDGSWRGRMRELDAHPMGYVFVIPPRVLTAKLEPDEDDVGQFMADHAEEAGLSRRTVDVDGEVVRVRMYRYKAVPGEILSSCPRKREIWMAMRSMVSDADMTRMDFGEGIPEVGRMLLDRIPDQFKDDLMRWGTGSYSHEGALTPTACWRFDKRLLADLRAGRMEFEDVAEPVGAETAGMVEHGFSR